MFASTIKQHLKFYNLRTALLFFVLVPFMVLIGLSGWYSLRNLETQIEASMQEEIELIARAIRLPLSYALERGSLDDIDQALDSAFHIDRVYGVYVYDESGRQIASSGTRRAQVHSDRAAQIAALGDRQASYEQLEHENIFSYFLPLTDTGGRISGLLQVTRRGSDFQNYLITVRQQALTGLGMLFAVLILIIYLGHHRAIGRHLQGIEKSLMNIDAGVTDQRVPVTGPVELQTLSHNINDMLNRINRSREEIDERRSRELELRNRLYQSEKLAAIGQLASGVAHELGTPLSTIDGQAQRLLRRSDTHDGVKQSLSQIRNEVERMESIIRQLLDFGRRNPLQRRQLNCGTLVQSVLDRLASQAEAHGVMIDIKPSTSALIVDVDTVRIEQALSNLLRNAIQAANKQVAVSWHEDGDLAIFSIEDDGPGIDKDQHPHLFEPFYTTKPVGKGTGLGLSVAHAAVNDHGGNIEIDQSPALGGARFRILIKRHPETDKEDK